MISNLLYNEIWFAKLRKGLRSPSDRNVLVMIAVLNLDGARYPAAGQLPVLHVYPRRHGSVPSVVRRPILCSVAHLLLSVSIFLSFSRHITPSHDHQALFFSPSGFPFPLYLPLIVVCILEAIFAKKLIVERKKSVFNFCTSSSISN